MGSDFKIFILNIVIAFIYSLSFYITYKELPQLKKYKFFSLFMFICGSTYIVELLDYIYASPITMFLLPILYFSISVILLRAFLIPFIFPIYYKSLIIGNSVILSYIVFNLLFISQPLKTTSRIINSVTLLLMVITIIYILVHSVKILLISPRTSKLIILRSILLIPYMIMVIIAWADQVLKLFNNSLLESYNEIFIINIFVLVSMAVCFTMEGASRVIMKLQYESDTDTLTGVPNRRHFVDRVTELIKDNRPLTLAIIDIDHFKKVNDTYGHDIGDEVLITFSDFMINNIRGDDFFGRIGGEEFSLVIQSKDSDTTIMIINRLRELITELKMSTTKESFSITVSIGIAHFKSGETYSQLSKRADRALYKAKEDGRNRCTIAQ